MSSDAPYHLSDFLTVSGVPLYRSLNYLNNRANDEFPELQTEPFWRKSNSIEPTNLCECSIAEPTIHCCQLNPITRLYWIDFDQRNIRFGSISKGRRIVSYLTGSIMLSYRESKFQWLTTHLYDRRIKI